MNSIERFRQFIRQPDITDFTRRELATHLGLNSKTLDNYISQYPGHFHYDHTTRKYAIISTFIPEDPTPDSLFRKLPDDPPHGIHGKKTKPGNT